MGDQILSALFLGLELYQTFPRNKSGDSNPILPLGVVVASSSSQPGYIPAAERQLTEPLDSATVSLVIVLCVAKCTQITQTFPECF